MTSGTPSSVFPGLLGDNIGLYRTRPENFLASLFVHAIAVALALWLATWMTHHPGENSGKARNEFSLGPISFLPQLPGGHGGGGTHDALAASSGALPTLTLADQLTPPEAVPLNPDPNLPEPPSVMALSDVKLPQLAELGDPLSAVQGPPSNGPGGGGGIGSGCCGGVGPRGGPGFGPYDAGNIFRPGMGGVTQLAPFMIRILTTPMPPVKPGIREQCCCGWSSARTDYLVISGCSVRWVWDWTRKRSRP